MAKAISPAALVALKEALTNLYWYKSDLRSFLASTISPALLASLSWQDYKRNIAAHVVDYMSKRQDQYQGDLLRLLSAVSEVRDFSHLQRLEGGAEKASAARASVEALRKHMAVMMPLRTSKGRSRSAVSVPTTHSSGPQPFGSGWSRSTRSTWAC